MTIDYVQRINDLVETDKVLSIVLAFKSKRETNVTASVNGINTSCVKDIWTHDPMEDLTAIDSCEYFVRCVLSYGYEKNCPCEFDVDCISAPENPCDSLTIQYPQGAILAPYICLVCITDRDWSDPKPGLLVINGTIKYRGYTITQSLILPFPADFRLSAI